MLWTALMRSDEDRFLILESDAKFLAGWDQAIVTALEHAPTNADFINLGPCCMEGHDKTPVGGGLYATKHAFCTHAYILRRDCIPFLLRTMRRCWAPIDCQLVLECYPHLNTYAVSPRIVEQMNTVLPA
jgi:GR25 family glycosyltransferase involved in LPS biosynthesis